MEVSQSNAKAFPLQTGNKIVVLDANQRQCRAFCAMLREQSYQVSPVHSLADLNRCLAEGKCLVAIIDLDTVTVDNRTIRELTIKNPGVYFLCLSSSRFHPELKEAICYHIYACINKPVDPDELFYLLRSIYADESGRESR